MDPDFARFRLGCRLETDTHPAVGFVALLETASGNGIGEGEELSGAAPLLVQSFDQEQVLMFEHGGESPAADVAVGGAVDSIADDHVVSGNGLRNGVGSRADAEEPARYFLAG